MTETATKTSAKPKAAEPYRGKRVIVWNPENDFRLGDQAPLRGYEMVRQYVFCWVDSAASEKVRQTTQPQFRELLLKPGLNWVEASEWETAIAVSAERHSAEAAEGNPKAVDEISELLGCRAILAFEPGKTVQSTRQFTGNLEDYDAQEIRRLMAQIDDVGALQEHAKRTQDYSLGQIIQERIDSLNTGY